MINIWHEQCSIPGLVSRRYF